MPSSSSRSTAATSRRANIVSEAGRRGGRAPALVLGLRGWGVDQETQEDDPVLELKGLCKSFGGLHAVRDVNLKIFRGDRKAIIGPNGAGKTTLFNVVTGILPATSGHVLLFGKDVTGWPSQIGRASGRESVAGAR